MNIDIQHVTNRLADRIAVLEQENAFLAATNAAQAELIEALTPDEPTDDQPADDQPADDQPADQAPDADPSA